MNTQIDVTSSRNKTLLLGAVAGTVVGLMGAYMFLQLNDESADSDTREIRKRDAVRVALALADVVRTVARS